MQRTATLLLTTALSLALAGIATAEPATIVKNPAKVAHREFDYDHQPADMPPIKPPEAAECQSQLSSEAALDAQGEQSAPDEMVVTIRSVRFTLNCKITLWLPKGYDKRILDHEEGHRRITETFYAKAETIAHAVCDPYVGRRITVRGSDLQAQLKAQLNVLAKEMSDKFQATFDIEKTQQRFDQINNHPLKKIAVDDAIRQAFAETAPQMTK
jgi:hypothetical protein